MMEKKWKDFTIDFIDKIGKIETLPTEAVETLSQIFALGDNIVRDFKFLKEREKVVDLVHDILWDYVRYDDMLRNLSYNMEPVVK